ncbi:MAG: replicative helicase [Fibrobacterota bacterium]|jgi:replicative DNA helicase
MSDRQGLPRSESAEQSILGVFLRFGYMVKASRLDKADFYSERHRAIFEAMQACTTAGDAVTIVSVEERLRLEKTLGVAGGADYLMDLADSVVSHHGWEGFEKIVLQKATLRAGIAIARRLNEDAFSDDREVDEIVADMAAAVSDLTRRSSAVTSTTWQTAFHLVTTPRKEDPTIPTGLDFLDSILQIRGGQLGIIAGRPGDGKSALATQMLLQIAKGAEALVCSLEMSPEEVAQRIIAQETGIPLWSIDAMRFASVQDRAKVEACRDAFRMNFCATPTVSELRAVAMVRKAQGSLRMIVVDYLQLLRTKKPSTSRTQDVTEISRDLKLLAMELQVPVVALSQFSREAAKGPPELHHLRESGSIEQDADWVLFCYADKGAQDSRMVSLAKNRKGRRVEPFAVGFHGETVSFGGQTL